MREIILTFNTLKTSLHINLFTFSSEMSNANTRSSLTDLRLPYVKTEFAKSNYHTVEQVFSTYRPMT